MWVFVRHYLKLIPLIESMEPAYEVEQKTQ
jgi:hypothetical protein